MQRRLPVVGVAPMPRMQCPSQLDAVGAVWLLTVSLPPRSETLATVIRQRSVLSFHIT